MIVRTGNHQTQNHSLKKCEFPGKQASNFKHSLYVFVFKNVQFPFKFQNFPLNTNISQQQASPIPHFFPVWPELIRAKRGKIPCTNLLSLFCFLNFYFHATVSLCIFIIFLNWLSAQWWKFTYLEFSTRSTCLHQKKSCDVIRIIVYLLFDPWFVLLLSPWINHFLLNLKFNSLNTTSLSKHAIKPTFTSCLGLLYHHCLFLDKLDEIFSGKTFKLLIQLNTKVNAAVCKLRKYKKGLPPGSSHGQ